MEDIRNFLSTTTFYHGSLTQIWYPDVGYAGLNANADFGPAFYLTTNELQAKEWADKKAWNIGADNYTVNSYRFTSVEGLSIAYFARPNEQWLNALIQGRLKGNTMSCDIVIGPVADGKIQEALKQYERDMQRRSKFSQETIEDIVQNTVQKLCVYKNYDQYALLSKRAVERLDYLGFKAYNRYKGLVREFSTKEIKKTKTKDRGGR